MKKKWLVLIVLAMLAFGSMTAVSLAAYRFSQTLAGGTMQAKTFTIKVNGSEQENQLLANNFVIAPGERASIPVVLDGSALDYSVSADITLVASYTGDFPPGLTISLEGVLASGANGIYSAGTHIDALDGRKTQIDVTTAWEGGAQTDFSAYEGFSIKLFIKIDAVQNV